MKLHNRCLKTNKEIVSKIKQGRKGNVIFFHHIMLCTINILLSLRDKILINIEATLSSKSDATEEIR